MSQTPHFKLDFLQPEQAQKHVTINDALRRLDGLVHLSVKSRALSRPPSPPPNGTRYLVGPKPQGAWGGQAGKLALYEDTAWHFFAPRIGWRLWDEAAKALLVYDGKQWQALQGSAAPQTNTQPASVTPSDDNESAVNLVRRITTESDISADALAEIPSHGIFLGLTALVLEEITGTTRWRLGVEGDGADRFGSGLSVAAGSEVRGPADPSVIYWQPTPIIARPDRGRFTGGRVLVSLFHIQLPVPSAPDR